MRKPMYGPEGIPCPSESLLSNFACGKLDAVRTESVRRHLETCPDCRQHVESRRAGALSPTLSFTGKPQSKRAHSPLMVPPALAKHRDYEIIKELGRGGMGVVYLAKNRIMDRLEVLKVVKNSLLDRPDSLERFQQEIRSAAKLAHANIVAAYSVLRPGNLLVLAMEYIAGQDLAQVVNERGCLPIANAAFYAHQVALGLQHAHEKGMVHRDIKPNNLMLAIEGKRHVVKILDFGLAKASSEQAAETALTRTGQMLGTPAYIAPEQTIDARRADIRADIYSLGCTLYHLLVGRPPFQEESLYELLDAHQKRDVQPLNIVRPDVPIELAAVVGKMLAKEPAKRYQTPSEVARALTPFFRPQQRTAAPSTNTGHAQPALETEHGHMAVTPAAPPPAAHVIPMATPVAIAAATPFPASAPANDYRISIENERPTARHGDGWLSLSPWQRMSVILSAAAATVVVLGAMFLRQTKDGGGGANANHPSQPELRHADKMLGGEKPAAGPGDAPADGKSTAEVFDGNDPSNWVPMRSLGAHEDVHEPTQSGWDFRGGEIVCTTRQPGWLKTKRQFADFELELEFNMPSQTNSDIFIRTPDWGKLSTSGIAIQLLAADVVGPAGSLPPEKQTGALWGITGPSENAQRPLSEWNTLTARCQGERIQVILNGIKVVDANETQYPVLRNRPRSGFVGISNWHGEAEGATFRNIRIRELPPTD